MQFSAIFDQELNVKCKLNYSELYNKTSDAQPATARARMRVAMSTFAWAMDIYSWVR